VGEGLGPAAPGSANSERFMGLADLETEIYRSCIDQPSPCKNLDSIEQIGTQNSPS